MEVMDISFRAICLGNNPPPYDSRPPFLGLFAFRPEDREFFFGRDALVQKLVARIKAHPFLAVLGASGSGKSSLVMAGLVPALEAQMSYLTPSSTPLSQLLTAKESASAKTVFVIDQFEELFTHPHDAAERADFIHALLDLTKTNRVVITMRADFWGEVAIYSDLKQAMQEHQELIAPMTVDELHSAMEKQAAVVGLRFDPTLSESILAEVKGEPGAMPLLQHALWELWNRRHGLWLKAEEYQAFGGVKQAIASTAEEVYASCSDFERARVRDIFLRLTRLDESGEGRDTRRRVLIEELIPVNSDSSVTIKLLNKLADARLIVKTDKDVEVAHEALIRHWSRLTEWLNEDRDNLRLREGVSESAREWDASKHDDSLLNHRGGRLELALAMSKLPRYQLNPFEQAYLSACINFIEKGKRAQRLQLMGTIGVFVVALIAISTIATLAFTGQFSRLIYRPLQMEWAEIPRGEFLMGSSDGEIVAVLKICPSCGDINNEQPQHLVYLDAYQIGRYEVTNKQYYQCILAGVCNRPTNTDYENPEFQINPVTDITWKDASIFCEWNGGRLPTEAEWEKAARGNITDTKYIRVYPWGNQWDPLKANVDAGDSGKVMPVGSYSPIGDSVYGVTDMSGNVWEWVMDWYDEGYYNISPSQNPTGVESGKYRVLRGGSFANSSINARSTYRAYNYIGSVSNDIGFRCAK